MQSEATPTQFEATPTPSAISQTNPDGTIADADGFVRFPGEPTRPDQAHYYVVEDICGQFTQAFMEGLSGKTFKKVVPITSSTTYACDYYTATAAADGKDAYLLVVLNYLNVARQKAAQVTLGRTITTNTSIPMDHWVAIQDNGVINAIYFVLGTDKFLRLDRSSTSILSDTDMLALAVKLGTKMKDFK
ncbi:MAG TPA: hypothetical protein VJ258_05295 [Candidatus Limnocylindrales bacterium]|jgi:hypothetical protein|nr:hypothetical protein [Candidatus Limnocylindrales bacterium]